MQYTDLILFDPILQTEERCFRIYIETQVTFLFFISMNVKNKKWSKTNPELTVYHT